MNIISCKDAKALGLKRYFTGKPCKHGHIAERQVTGGCVECHLYHTKKYYSENKDLKHTGHQKWVEENREQARLNQRNYYARNSELVRAGQTYARAKRLQRVVEWTEIDQIKEFYAACPVGMQVDHILPLQGELVSGLHVLTNLQYLSESENKSKRNYIDLEEYNKCISI